jgi:hypothetical protein
MHFVLYFLLLKVQQHWLTDFISAATIRNYSTGIKGPLTGKLK